MTPIGSIHPVGIGGCSITLRVARLATYAGGLVVMKRGTATVSDDELWSIGDPKSHSTQDLLGRIRERLHDPARS